MIRRKTAQAVREDQGGFTMLEMLVTMSIVVLVLLCIYQVYEVSQATVSRGEVKTDIQQNARFALGVMERELRMAGYGVPSPACPATLPVILDARRRSITFRADLRNVLTALTSAANTGTNTLTVNASTGIAANDVIYLTDGTTCATHTIQSVAGGTLTLTANLTSSYASGSRVYRTKDIAYTITGGQIVRDERNPGAAASASPPVLATKIPDADIFRYFDATNAEITTNNPVADPSTVRRIRVSLIASDTPRGLPQQNFSLVSDVRPRNP